MSEVEAVEAARARAHRVVDVFHLASGIDGVPGADGQPNRAANQQAGTGQPRDDAVEVELAVIIGKPARHLNADNALDCVFGYSCFNDISVRDYQKKTPQWTM